MVWPVSLVELRVCFSWGSGFWEFSSWVNWGGQAESQLKQKPCLAGWRCPKLGFWFVVGVFPGLMVWPDAESYLKRV